MRQISARVTPTLKYLGPTAWVLGWGYATILLFEDPGAFLREGNGVAPAVAKWVFLGIAVIGGLVLARYVVPLKRVVLEGDNLIVSNYLREITIPLTDVSLLWPERHQEDSSPFAIITLRTRSEFGDRIRFLLRSEEAYNALRSALSLRDMPADQGGTADLHR